MNDLWLLLDVPYLAYRAYHSTGDLSFEGVATGVLYGVFRDIIGLQRQFGTSRIAFTFDRGKNLRQVIYPAYKCRTTHDTTPEANARRELRRQIHLLREDYLSEIGFRNVFSQDGLEADDLIASLVQRTLPGKEVVIVSADKDLYQLLSPKVTLWNPRTKVSYTQEMLKQGYGIAPAQWHLVKALAGCTSDNVQGIKGVGDLTAARFLRGQVKEGSVVHKSILAGEDIWKRNIPLVKLPFAGTGQFQLEEDEVSPTRWRGLLRHLGMKSLWERLVVGR